MTAAIMVRELARQLEAADAEIERLKAELSRAHRALDRACHDGWEDGDEMVDHYLRLAEAGEA